MFMAEVSRRFGDHLGALEITGPKLSYPLSLQMAERYTSGRLALIGDAAHVVHPIAGQGLNMGLRDVAALADVIAGAQSTGLDIGGAELEAYAQWRRGDNRILGAATDQMNRLFSNPIAPLRHLRRLGLAAVDKTDIARTFFMAEAAGELGELPALLRA
jgi:2-octaprenyl-6-methoxyphenol hydroxylase